ncbi:MAG: helix-turn-helix domain-containing protein [Gemmatimonadaceae bacterium]
MLALKRRQLDAKLESKSLTPTPKAGWIRTSREALGMSSVQLGRRLGVSQQEAADLERRETVGSISIGTLAKAAAALGCDLGVTFVPKTSYDAIAREQAAAKARAERNRVVHTMRLEAQEEGVVAALGDDAAIDVWLTKRLPQLWD